MMTFSFLWIASGCVEFQPDFVGISRDYLSRSFISRVGIQLLPVVAASLSCLAQFWRYLS